MHDFLSFLFLFSPVFLVLGIYLYRSYEKVPLNEVHALSRGDKVTIFNPNDSYFFINFIHERARLMQGKVKLDIPEFSFLDKMNNEIIIKFSCVIEVVNPALTLSSRHPMELEQVEELVKRGIESTFQSHVRMRTLLQVQSEINQLERSTNNSVQETIKQYGYDLVSLYVEQIQNAGTHSTQLY